VRHGHHDAFGLDRLKGFDGALRVRDLGDGVLSSKAASSDEDMAATCAFIRHRTA
jgi:hypothetical protein